ncbi:hypothetical protein IC757_10160 [Wenzhouxiangella sp. AB-CW3]|uniref:hypothetical protein n=1 Tax=Wenzhouxiangella sp. AB-CW3 TaxID=2771012 RepID=UPI00168BF114|nr:hypothetical protein [Wenzhouxiangella sp. AB-CW3]QOC21418.1 hypothetical protein IC757_10160 [Wenzhouxiangella sp. AB-CW3]
MLKFSKQTMLMAALLAMAVPGQADDWDDDPWDDDVSAFEWYGFIEGAAGHRLQSNPVIGDDFSLGELRLQLEGRYEGDVATWRMKLDGIADGVTDEFDADLREAMVSFPFGERTDVRLGRQVLTWGTGDLVFLNDLFPKDWESFLIGRDDDYLKGTSDAARISWYGERINLETVITPLFEPDRFPDGQRLSYFDPMQGDIVGAPPRLRGVKPPRTAENAELALRLHGRAGAQEWALYGYRGFFPQPSAFDPESGQFTFAPMNAVGGSLRGPLAGGLYNLETSYYDSRDNRDGDNSLLPNSEIRFLAGFEREMVTNFTMGAQYYLEWLQDYSAMRRNWPMDPATLPEERRHLATVRLTWRMMRDNLIVSLMNFYSPSDDDYFIRPTVQYRHTDQLQFNAGINLFGGSEASTFYGQFEENSSIFVRLRYSF